MSPEKPDALLWMDVETTGLDTNRCSILEIGLRCTSMDATREHARLEAIIHISRETMLTAQLPALDLHLNYGLLARGNRTGSHKVHRGHGRHVHLASRRHEHPTLRFAHDPQILRQGPRIRFIAHR